jgi:hypothetical protein
MKEGIKFIATYSILSFALFGISKLIFKELTAEIFSYLLFYYIITLSIGVILYPILSWLLDKYGVSVKLKFIFSLFLCILIINSLPFFYDNGRLLIIDIAKGIFINQSLLGFNNIGIHIIAIISFIVCYVLYRDDKYWRRT